MAASAELMNKIRIQYPWMTNGLLQTYEKSWGEYEDPDLALSEVRQSGEYAGVFGGNYDSKSGDVRMTESDYFASKAEFDANLISIGVNPDHFQNEWETALEGEVSPGEMGTRIQSAYERIIDAAPAIRDYYSKNFGIDMTDSAILASVLSPRIGEEILSKRISMAEIGGEASVRGFNIGGGMAEELFRAGLGRNEAAGFFGQAANTLPGLNVLAARHADPDDDFDLEELTQAMIYDDPEQRRRMRRLVAQESSTFGPAGVDVNRSRTTGGLSGLQQS